MFDKNIKGWEQFNHENLFVIDFSAVVNVKSQEELNTLTHYLLHNNIKVSVSREFYENYEVIIKSRNDEQVAIAKMTAMFLDSIEKTDSLLYMSDIVDSKEIVEKFHKNPKNTTKTATKYH